MEFKDRGTEDIFHGEDTRDARQTLPSKLHAKAARLLDRIGSAGRPFDLRVPRGNRLEQLSGDRAEQWSVRINDQYRICFVWDDDEAIAIEIIDYH